MALRGMFVKRVLLSSLLAASDAFTLPHAAAAGLRVPARSCSMMAVSDLPVSETSSLTELRAYIKEQGLDVKTSGAGRRKEEIYRDVIAAVSDTAAPESPESSIPPEAETCAESEGEAAADAKGGAELDGEAAVEEMAEQEDMGFGAAPDGFEWGITYGDEE